MRQGQAVECADTDCANTERLVADALAAIVSSPDVTPAQAELPLIQKHHLIRRSDQYADLFARCSAQS